MATSVHEIVNSPKFKGLVTKRWSVSFILTFLLFILYFGYILTVGYGKGWLVQKVGPYANIGIIYGAVVIVGAWILTMIYVVWANTSYDKTVEELKKEFYGAETAKKKK
jgi:uncharacterized membrane protein (DUF485 family)